MGRRRFELELVEKIVINFVIYFRARIFMRECCYKGGVNRVGMG